MIVVKNNHVYSKKINGCWYVLRERSRYMHELSASAGVIWEALDRPISTSRVVKIVAKKYSVSAEDIFEDIISYVDQLIQEKYVLVVKQ